MTDTATLAKAAAQALVDALWPEGSIARGMTCREAEAVAEFIAATLGKEQGDLFIQAHSVADDEGDQHAELGKRMRARGTGWSGS